MLPLHRLASSRQSRPFPRSCFTLLSCLVLGSLILLLLLYSNPPPRPSFFDHPPPPPPLSDASPLFEDGKINDDVMDGPLTEDKFSEEQLMWKARAESVKASFLHAWNAYEKHAWGWDEIKPLSAQPVTNFNGWGVSIVDSLDTLLIMDLRPQFARAMDHVASMNFTQTTYEAAPFFETIIRYLGGLLSAYALVVDDGATSALKWEPVQIESVTPSQISSNVGGNGHEANLPYAAGLDLDKRASSSWPQQERTRIANILLTRADHLARALLPAFNTTSSLPTASVNTVTGHQQNTWSIVLAELGSCQMEYKYLAHLTGRKEYFDAVNNVTNIMETLQRKELQNPASVIGGMFPTRFSTQTGEPQDTFISVGSLADSAYEYLLKVYLMSGRTEHRLLDMYLASSHTTLRNLTYLSHERDLVYVTDSYGGNPSYRMEHLSCFFPGLLALGVETLNSRSAYDGKAVKIELPDDVKDRHLWAAEAIAETCWLFYADNPTALGSEEVAFDRPLIALPQDVLANASETQQPRFKNPLPSQNLWWDSVDDWLQKGKQGDRPRGFKGNQRQPVITNGGKGSWEVLMDQPAENERPLILPEGVTEETPTNSHWSDSFRNNRTHKRDYMIKDDRWLMRPETIESLYLMFRVTRDPIWRNRCYDIYLGMEKYSRTQNGYASVHGIAYERDATTGLPKALSNVSATNPRYDWRNGWVPLEDSMPSYALAETFKYMYLCLLDPDESAALLPSDKWIFNTEAHPLPVFNWSKSEMENWIYPKH